jgi:hypothetical protein
MERPPDHWFGGRFAVSGAVDREWAGTHRLDQSGY